MANCVQIGSIALSFGVCGVVRCSARPRCGAGAGWYFTRVRVLIGYWDINRSGVV